MQSLTKEFNLFFSLSIILILSKATFTFLGNFSLSFKISSLKNKSSNFWSTVDKSLSSCSFIVFLSLVKIFWIFNFNSSPFPFISSTLFFN